jgi:type II secretory pathway predicted ATPase ExeA
MYSKYFGFEEFPFSVTPDPRFFYSNVAYLDVLAGLEHGIEARNGFTVITGEAGTGKTTLLHRLVSSSGDTIEYALIIDPRLSFIPLLRTILQNLGLPSSSTDRETLLEQLNGHLREQFTKGRSVALLFDEAQSLSDEVLEELRLLCNQEIGGATLTSIVLIGQPELEHRLDHSRLRQIKQRITSRRRLTPLQDLDVPLYVASRLEHVGYKGGELFEPAAIERIISWSSGIPRLINTICDNALLIAYQASERTVTAGMIDEVANHLRLVERPSRAHQKNVDEVANRLRLVERSQRASDQSSFVGRSSIAEKIDEVADQARFVDRPPEIDEVANRLRLVERSQRASDQSSFVGRSSIAEKIDEVADQARFVDRPPEIDEVANQLPLDDRPPIEDQEQLDEVGEQATFVGRSPIAEKIDEVADQPRFIDRPPIEDQESIDEARDRKAYWRFSFHWIEAYPKAVASCLRKDFDQLLSFFQIKNSQLWSRLRTTNLIERAFREVRRRTRPMRVMANTQKPRFDDRPTVDHRRKIDGAANQLRFVDHFSVADQGRVDEVVNQMPLVDDRSAGSDQKPVPEIDQPQKLDIAFPPKSVEAGSIVDDNAREISDQLIPPIYQAKTVGRRNYQLSKVNRLRISIGALMILVVVAGGLAVFYPRQREAAVPGNRYAENLSRGANKTAVPAVPVDNVKNNGDVNTKKMVEEPPQPVLATPPPVLENRDQNRDTRKKQNIVEAGNSGKTTDPASQEIYRVSGASFLRKRPAADAEIIDTLKPGIRIVVTNRSGEYLRVRSLSDETVSGFVHKEDAFFERIR